MKTKPFFLIVVFSGLLLTYGCSLFETEDLLGGFMIYKTKGDYKEYITVGLKDGKIVRSEGDTNITRRVTSDSLCADRIPLVNGYEMGRPFNIEKDAYVKITFKEFLQYCDRHNVGALPSDTIYKYILDTDPFTEAYREITTNDFFECELPYVLPDTAVVNQIIRNNEIDKYFNKVK